MSFWNKLINSIKDTEKISVNQATQGTSRYAFVDVEVGLKDNKIHDIGALRYDQAVFHSANKRDLLDFLKDVVFVCGHNIINHDAKYLFEKDNNKWILVDTLYISPLLFPERPYHRLLKDDKLVSEQINNPVNDCEKAQDLFMDEVARWNTLSDERKIIFATLLQGKNEFDGFLRFVDAKIDDVDNIANLIRLSYRGLICESANIENIISQYPCELAYALALIDTTDHRSITPPWVLCNYPNVEHIVRLLRHSRCLRECCYCNKNLDAHYNLKQYFGYDQFRTYEGEPLQEQSVCAAIDGKSLLAIFPTGGGKSLTFQLPALIEGRSVHGLTIVISPLQSLMKDQVDNLAERGITDAVTINGLLDPISRSLAIQRVLDGDASLLYIAPEMLRSKTIEKILLARHVVRFVIDEAHCFSSWGQDFRVDYLYIGKFISEYQKKKNITTPIPISCFTATAKQKVVQDICDYFKQTLNLDLQIFASTASRTNLQYSVIHADTDEDKYMKLRSLIAEISCPTIVYVSRTKRTKQLAETLAKKALSEKESAEHDKAIAVAEKNVIDNAIIRAKSEKVSAERDRDKAMAEKKEFEMERDQTEAIIVQNLEKYESLKTKHGELIEKYNGLVGRYNNTLDDLQSWRSARDWQLYLIDYLDKVMYENDQTVKYAVDSLISYANNNDGRGGHQDFLHDDQSAAIKMVMTNFSPNDKSVWMKIAAWLLHLAKSIGNLGEQAVRLIAKDLNAVADGRYDWRIERFMRNNDISRTP